MTGRPGRSRFLPLLAAGVLAGCHLPATQPPALPMAVGPVDVRTGYAAGTLVPVTVPTPAAPAPLRGGAASGKGSSPQQETARAAAPAPATSTKQKAAALTAKSPATDELQWVAAAPLKGHDGAIGIEKLPRLRPPVVIREESNDDAKLPTPPPPRVEQMPSIPLPPDEQPVSPVTTSDEPPIRPAAPPVLPVSSSPPQLSPFLNARELPPVPDTPPATLPPPGAATVTPSVLPVLPGSTPALLPSDGLPGPITIGGRPLTFDALTQMVDGSGFTAGGGGTGCATCGGGCPPGRPCAAGGHRCEPFPHSKSHVVRFVGLLYENICCPDPCYQPRWEPIADSAFFIDPARPINNTRVRWDYGDHLTYPDRGELFWARADGNGKGPKPTDSRVLAVPYLDYHELSIVSEIASGSASVAISLPYRTVNTTPFGNDSAGFADMSITAKSLLVDSELFLCTLVTRTYILTGNVGKGLGTGHMSLEPGLLFGLRLTPKTYLQGQVLEWIPLGGDSDYAGAALRWGVSVNHICWQPVKDVRLIGTLELNGISFQDGLFTDPEKGSQKLSGLNALSMANGWRLFFCDSMDIGVAWSHGITGKYLVRDQMRFEMRFRY